MNLPASPPLPFRLPLVAILRGITPNDAVAHVAALVEEGYDGIEIPLNSPQWERSIGDCVRAFGTRALIGGELYRPGQSVEVTRANAIAFRQALQEHAA